MNRFENCRICVILDLISCVSYSFCNCEGSKSSLLKFLALGEILAMIFVENFLSDF